MGLLNKFANSKHAPLIATGIVSLALFASSSCMDKFPKRASKFIAERQSVKSKHGINITLQVDRNKDGAIDYIFDNGNNAFISEKLPDGSYVYRHGRLGKVDDLTAYRLDNGDYMTLKGIVVKNQVIK